MPNLCCHKNKSWIWVHPPPWPFPPFSFPKETKLMQLFHLSGRFPQIIWSLSINLTEGSEPPLDQGLKLVSEEGRIPQGRKSCGLFCCPSRRMCHGVGRNFMARAAVRRGRVWIYERKNERRAGSMQQLNLNDHNYQYLHIFYVPGTGHLSIS